MQNIQIGLSGAAKWSNLEQWLELFHKGSTYIALGNDQTMSKYQVIAHAFRVVDALRGTPWAVVKKVLEEFRDLAVENDGSWSWAKEDGDGG